MFNAAAGVYCGVLLNSKDVIDLAVSLRPVDGQRPYFDLYTVHERAEGQFLEIRAFPT